MKSRRGGLEGVRMSEQNARADDILTLVAAGALAYACADLAHHVLGHAAACVAVGGRVLSISPTHVSCTATGVVVDLAGPAANLVVGLAALCGLAWPTSQQVLRLFLLELAGFNLLWLTGQLIYSALAEKDDWRQLIISLPPGEPWKAIFTAAGVLGYLGVLRLLSAAFSPLAASSSLRLLKVVVAAYVGGGLAAGAIALGQAAPADAFVLAAPQALLLPLGILFLRPLPSRTIAPSIRLRLPVIAGALILSGLAAAFFNWSAS